MQTKDPADKLPEVPKPTDEAINAATEVLNEDIYLAVKKFMAQFSVVGPCLHPDTPHDCDGGFGFNASILIPVAYVLTKHSTAWRKVFSGMTGEPHVMLATVLKAIESGTVVAENLLASAKTVGQKPDPVPMLPLPKGALKN